MFGRELTNLAAQEQARHKRNSSYLHHDRLKDNKPMNPRNHSVIIPSSKATTAKVENTDPQMVPEYFEDNLQFMKTQELTHPPLGNYLNDHETVS
jgi:hypothetical protein